MVEVHKPAVEGVREVRPPDAELERATSSSRASRRASPSLCDALGSQPRSIWRFCESQVARIDRAVAERITAVREEYPRLLLTQDAGRVLDLKASTVDLIRRHVVVLPRGVDRI